MKIIDMENSKRKKIYEWFKTFDNSTYGLCVNMNVTALVNHCKNTNESFFIDMLYIVTSSLNSVEEMKIRYENNKVVLYDDINPAYTVMTKSGIYNNANHENSDDFKTFYKRAKKSIDETKNENKLNDRDYNPKNTYNEYYITCLPWLNFNECHHPIPNDKSSQTVPRICWGKYEEKDNEYFLTLNITVSHMFVDGYNLSCTFNKIQEELYNCDDILK